MHARPTVCGRNIVNYYSEIKQKKASLPQRNRISRPCGKRAPAPKCVLAVLKGSSVARRRLTFHLAPRSAREPEAMVANVDNGRLHFSRGCRQVVTSHPRRPRAAA